MRIGEKDLRVALCGIGVLLIGYLDYVTGPTISLTLLYLIPVVAAGWTAGQRRAIVIALLAGAISLIDVVTGSTQTTAALVWNAVSRALILTVAAVAVERIRRDRDRLVVQDAQRARSLELLDRGLADPARQLVELSQHWDGSAEELKQLVRRRADEMMFLARDFSSMVRLQNGELPLRPVTFDFVELIDELREEQQRADRRILMTGPSSPLPVTGDRARIRQTLAALISERAAGDELSFLVDKRGDKAELVISSGAYRPAAASVAGGKDELGLSAELAQLLFSAQGGSVELARNPLTRSLRVTARLPLA
jgi:signal transduction histidine kinase